ncbi:ATP-grasp domain-containing protein [Virgibacillus soli]|uniref:ATP-grasp domain-containing protein n=1 Tax=Paracerasibacillus soli TaxID=480284 RepID=A0ABU5CSZ2_9BACI|nr:ATP-grasp domain-containing protein [Virgibacillus soli]MDY0409355.1 ATP-grasp domain-containing protein [Virgibacillus soli]
MHNVLVFPCGSEIGLEIHNALKYAKDIKLFGASSVKDHGKYVYKNYISNLPFVDDDSFIPYINNIIKKYNIDYIFPAHDSVVLKLGELKPGVLKAKVITSSPETCVMARSKYKTYQKLQGECFTPKIYSSDAIESAEFPVFLKPDVGQGSMGIAMAEDISELKMKIGNAKQKMLICEYLPGEEFTIDCFTNRKRELLFIGPRKRNRIKNGISVNTNNIKIQEQISFIAKRLNEVFEFRGAWFFQVKRDKMGNLKLLEIAPRIAGSMATHRNRGINFPLITLFDFMGYDVEIIENEFNVEVDRALINRFSFENISYDTVYIDFDDTITLGKHVNPKIIAFLYQCLNKEKKIILITKHARDIADTLYKLKIDKNIFDNIIHLDKNEEKYKKIDAGNNAIFIDDSYQERKAISENMNIPVFDVDAVESLIDWRL